MRVYGLTGNIGCGKSTVAKLLRERGAPVIDADVVAREVVLPGTPALAEIAARFPGVLEPGGALDRTKLGALVFADPAQRAALNAIVHPRIAEEVSAHLRALADAGRPFAFYEAALIVESGMDAGLDGLVVVTAPPDVQLRRLRARDGSTEAAARARIAAQLSQEEKVKRATWVIDNGGPPEALVPQLDGLLRELEGRG